MTLCCRKGLRIRSETVYEVTGPEPSGRVRIWLVTVSLTLEVLIVLS